MSMAMDTPQKRYEARMIVKKTFNFNRKTDADCLNWIDRQENKQGAVKGLIRAEIAREAGLTTAGADGTMEPS